MTSLMKNKTLIEIEELSDEGKREIAAAKAEVKVSNLLRKAFRLSQFSQAYLAEKLGVTEGRVSQVLNSGGNLRITTVSRFLRVMGYELVLDAIPVDPGVPNLRNSRQPRRNQIAVHIYSPNSSNRAANTLVISSTSDLRGFSVDSLDYRGSIQVNSHVSGLQVENSSSTSTPIFKLLEGVQ